MVAIAPAAAVAETLEPSVWPAEIGLGSAPNAIRFGGADRYHTGLAASLALRGTGEFPFDTPDRTTGQWWGAATCPTSIVIVAGDTPADALAAASLSDPTNRGNEPRLQRVASADPSFDVVGDDDRVDTDAAPIVVTTSGRSGAQGLAAPARAAAIDLRRGGCTTAREAIIVGGEAAVPVEVEGELIGVGYEEVFRVAGVDRADTAARIATALGTEAPPAGADCVDERSDDRSSALGFYGNAVIEYRPDAASCQLQGRAVVLADGTVGADALAAGWWTSYWQVPVLLVNGDGSLPPATRSALASLDIDTIVVLGGTARVPESVVEEAARLATAVAGRFAGQDRYETSVVGAKVFGGWHPTGDGTDFAADRLCLAGSSGATVGWPDALTAGPWCGRLGHLAGSRLSPSRVMEPIEDAGTAMTPPRPAHDAVPVVLVPGGAPPTDAVTELLAEAFPPASIWCVGAIASACVAPGFAVAFGGSATVSDAALATVSAALSGGDDAQRGAEPVLVEPFRTELDLAPIYARDPDDGPARGCLERDGVRGARWLATYAEPELTAFVGSLDLPASSTYVDGTSTPVCLGLGDTADPVLVGVSAAGRADPQDLGGDASRSVTLSGPISHSDPASSDGASGTDDEPGAETTWRFSDPPSPPVQLRDGEQVLEIEMATIDVLLTRGEGTDPDEFFAQMAIDAGPDGYLGVASGEAVRDGDRWQLAGRFRMPGPAGGFRATLHTLGTADAADDRLTWRFDAFGP